MIRNYNQNSPFRDWDKRQHVQNYGAANAVADIVGAIIQRNKERKDNDNVLKTAEIMAGLGGDQAPQTPQPQQQQGLFGNISLQNPIPQNQAMPQTNQPAQGLFNNPNIAQPMTGEQTNNEQSLLTKPITEANIPISRPQEAQTTPQEQSISAPNKMSLNRQKMAYKADLLKQLKGKGVTDFRSVLPQVDAMTEDYGNNLYNQQSQQYMDSMLNKFASMPNMDDKTAYIWAVKAKTSGLPVDPDQFAKMYAAKKLEGINLEDRYEFVDPTKPGTYYKGVSPTAVYNKNTVSADTQYKVANRPVGGGRSSGGFTPAQQRAASNKLSDARAIMSAYNDGGKLTYDKEGNEVWKPYTTAEQIKFNQAAEYIKANDPEWGTEPAQPQPQAAGGGDAGAQWYYQTADAIKAQHPDATEEEITAFMTNLINGG